MEIPGQTSSSSHLLKLRMSLYGLKNASYNWHQKLKAALEAREFKESLSDPCVFISKNMVILTYVDDCILIAKDESVLQDFIISLESGPENFIFTDEGSMSSYLGVAINKLPNKGFELTQPHLIDRIIKTLNFDPKETKGARGNTPAAYPLLSKDSD